MANWIQGAIKPSHKNIFKEAAKEHGEGVQAFAHTVLKPGSKASTTTKRRAVLAETLAKMHHGKKKESPKLTPKK